MISARYDERIFRSDMKKSGSDIHPRMQRELKTVACMIERYCRDQHHTREELCRECQELAEYARFRLKRCPFQENKTTCGNCPIHCYKPGMRERIRNVMRYAGPRMIRRHPLLAIGHMLDGLRKKPGPRKKNDQPAAGKKDSKSVRVKEP